MARLTTHQTATALGVSVQVVQYGIQQGQYPFGVFLKRSGASRGMYDIQSSKLAEHLGISEEELNQKIGGKNNGN